MKEAEHKMCRQLLIEVIYLKLDFPKTNIIYLKQLQISKNCNLNLNKNSQLKQLKQSCFYQITLNFAGKNNTCKIDLYTEIISIA